MKMERSQQTTQKYKDHKRLLSATICNKMDSLEETDAFLEKYSLSKLTQEEIENLNRPITCTGIETVIKKSSNKQKPRTRWLHS